MTKTELRLAKALTIFRQHTGEDNIKQYLLQQNDLIENTDKLNLSDLDIIEIIQAHPDSRISEIVAHSNFTQSAVSKIINKLYKFHFVQKHQASDNKKNTYISLTATGSHVAKLHQEFHQEQRQQLSKLLSEYTTDDLNKFSQLIEQINTLRE